MRFETCFGQTCAFLNGSGSLHFHWYSSPLELTATSSENMAPMLTNFTPSWKRNRRVQYMLCGVKVDHLYKPLTKNQMKKPLRRKKTELGAPLSAAYLVWPPLELLSQGDRTLDRNALLVQVGLTFTAGGASFRVERGPIQPSAFTQSQHRLTLTQQL